MSEIFPAVTRCSLYRSLVCVLRQRLATDVGFANLAESYLRQRFQTKLEMWWYCDMSQWFLWATHGSTTSSSWKIRLDQTWIWYWNDTIYYIGIKALFRMKNLIQITSSLKHIVSHRKLRLNFYPTYWYILNISFTLCSWNNNYMSKLDYSLKARQYIIDLRIENVSGDGGMHVGAYV